MVDRARQGAARDGFGVCMARTNSPAPVPGATMPSFIGLLLAISQVGGRF